MYATPTPLFFSSTVYWVLIIAVFVFSLYAQVRVSRAYHKNSQIGSRGGVTGRDAAAAVMAQAGIHDVEIVEAPGRLVDHYDPTQKRLVLSSENYRGTSLAAVGVAAHEAGHALQHKEGYQMLEFRMALVPATRFASMVAPWIYLVSYLALSRATSFMILDIAIICYAVLTLFQLITLPVEFDASRRAKQQLVTLGILDRGEMPGVNETLNAAALTYLAAFAGAFLNLLYLISRRN